MPACGSQTLRVDKTCKKRHLLRIRKVGSDDELAPHKGRREVRGCCPLAGQSARRVEPRGPTCAPAAVAVPVICALTSIPEHEISPGQRLDPERQTIEIQTPSQRCNLY